MAAKRRGYTRRLIKRNALGQFARVAGSARRSRTGRKVGRRLTSARYNRGIRRTGRAFRKQGRRNNSRGMSMNYRADKRLRVAQTRRAAAFLGKHGMRKGLIPSERAAFLARGNRRLGALSNERRWASTRKPRIMM